MESEIFTGEIQYPYQVVENSYNEGDILYLQDLPGYKEPVDFLIYLLPLLYEKEVTTLDFWFLPEEEREAMNRLIQNPSGDEKEIIEELKNISAYLLQDRYLELFLSLKRFNLQLSGEETPFTLVSKEGVRTLVLLNSIEAGNQPMIQIYGPGSLPDQQKHRDQLQDKIDQGYVYHIEYIGEEQTPWLIEVSPEKFTPSVPLVKELTKEDIPQVLKDFPDVSIVKPPALVLRILRNKLKKDYSQRVNRLDQ